MIKVKERRKDKPNTPSLGTYRKGELVNHGLRFEREEQNLQFRMPI